MSEENIMYKIFIDGESGTTGLRIKDRLSKRSDIEILHIDEAKRKDDSEIKKLLNMSDVTFLCLPDESAKNAVKLLDNSNKHTVIIDASTAHRTESDWTYGFPELSSEYKENIKTKQLIANPGCYASGFISIIFHIITRKVISDDIQLSVFAFSGYSGGGKKAIADYEQKDCDIQLKAPRIYGLNQEHKHLPEMQKICGLKKKPVFVPSICPYKSGMIVSIPFSADGFTTSLSPFDITENLKSFYSGSKLIKVRPYGYTEGMLSANVYSGRDDMEIEVFGNNERMLITSRFDNLGKGASGAAIQCMNLALGIDEYKSLVIGD